MHHTSKIWRRMLWYWFVLNFDPSESGWQFFHIKPWWKDVRSRFVFTKQHSTDCTIIWHFFTYRESLQLWTQLKQGHSDKRRFVNLFYFYVLRTQILTRLSVMLHQMLNSVCYFCCDTFRWFSLLSEKWLWFSWYCSKQQKQHTKWKIILVFLLR